MNFHQLKKTKGFTLIEIIVVIIIVGILASLALPKLFKMIEYSRSTEALSYLGELKRAMDRCGIQASDQEGNPRYQAGGCVNTLAIGIDDISNSPGAHFGNTVISLISETAYKITVTRNTFEQGTPTDTIYLNYAYTTDGQFRVNDTTVTRRGTGNFTTVR